MDPCAFFRKLQFYIIWLFLSPSRLISPNFLFSLIFKFPCTMGEDIRIFHIEIIHFIGCNITTVIVIIFIERTFELLYQLVPKIRTYLDSGIQQFCVLFRIRMKFSSRKAAASFLSCFLREKSWESRISRLLFIWSYFLDRFVISLSVEHCAWKISCSFRSVTLEITIIYWQNK